MPCLENQESYVKKHLWGSSLDLVDMWQEGCNYSLKLKLDTCTPSHINQLTEVYTLVSFPDPTLCEGKGGVYIERFFGLDDVMFQNCHANQNRSM